MNLNNNYVARAKALLGGETRKIALKVIPLALVAMAVNAGTVSFPALTGVNPVSGGGAPASFASATSGGSIIGPTSFSFSAFSPLNGFGGGKVYGGTTWSSTSGFFFTGEGLRWVANGPAQGQIPSGGLTIPVGVQFALTDAQGLPLGWSISYQVNYAGGGSATGGSSGSLGSGGGAVDYTDSLSFAGGKTLIGYTVEIDGWLTSGSIPSDILPDGTVMVVLDVPANSIDFNKPPSGVPEPATMLLVVPVLGLAFLLKRRRKRDDSR